jgi:hypothetical protein
MLTAKKEDFPLGEKNVQRESTKLEDAHIANVSTTFAKLDEVEKFDIMVLPMD